jgi:hypothetical protein
MNDQLQRLHGRVDFLIQVVRTLCLKLKLDPDEIERLADLAIRDEDDGEVDV